MVGTRGAVKFSVRLLAAAKAIWKGGSPFNALTAVWPTNDEGKYVIEAEGIRLAFTNHGAALTNLWINDTNGQEIDVVLGLDHADLYPKSTSNPYLNGIIGKSINKLLMFPLLSPSQNLPADETDLGRYAGYLNGSGYEDVDGIRHQVGANANGGTATYNGGRRGWGRTDWEVPYHSPNSILFVYFDYKKNGFPGIFVGCVTHTVYPNEWHIGYGVTPLLAEGGPLNLGQQVFFNLDGMRTGNETNTVLDHKLHLPLSGLRFGVDELGIPTGDLLSNRKGKEHDFWSGPKEIGEVLKRNPQAPSYDETFMLSHRHLDSKREHAAAILSSARSGITMEVYTDQDALHVHTWSQKNGPLKLKDNQGEGDVPVHGAISLEQQDWPDGVNHPEWFYRKTLWGSLDIYNAYVAYKFKVDRKEKETTGT